MIYEPSKTWSPARFAAVAVASFEGGNGKLKKQRRELDTRRDLGVPLWKLNNFKLSSRSASSESAIPSGSSDFSSISLNLNADRLRTVVGHVCPSLRRVPIQRGKNSPNGGCLKIDTNPKQSLKETKFDFESRRVSQDAFPDPRGVSVSKELAQSGEVAERLLKFNLSFEAKERTEKLRGNPSHVLDYVSNAAVFREIGRSSRELVCNQEALSCRRDHLFRSLNSSYHTYEDIGFRLKNLEVDLAKVNMKIERLSRMKDSMNKMVGVCELCLRRSAAACSGAAAGAIGAEKEGAEVAFLGKNVKTGWDRILGKIDVEPKGASAQALLDDLAASVTLMKKTRGVKNALLRRG